jgi:hypothetical protein
MTFYTYIVSVPPLRVVCRFIREWVVSVSVTVCVGVGGFVRVELHIGVVCGVEDPTGGGGGVGGMGGGFMRIRDERYIIRVPEEYLADCGIPMRSRSRAR